MPAQALATLTDLLRGGLPQRGLVRTGALLCADAAVADAIVLPRGPGHARRLVAYLVPVPAAVPAPGVLHAALAGLLPARLVPDAYVVLARLPRRANGSIDEAALPAPDAAALGLRLYEPPRGRLEQAIAVRWQALLGVPEVGRGGHFIELGGHSALAVQFVHELRRELGVDVVMRDLLREPRLCDFAVLVERRLARGRAANRSAARPAPALHAPA